MMRTNTRLEYHREKFVADWNAGERMNWRNGYRVSKMMAAGQSSAEIAGQISRGAGHVRGMNTAYITYFQIFKEYPMVAKYARRNLSLTHMRRFGEKMRKWEPAPIVWLDKLYRIIQENTSVEDMMNELDLEWGGVPPGYGSDWLGRWQRTTRGEIEFLSGGVFYKMDDKDRRRVVRLARSISGVFGKYTDA